MQFLDSALVGIILLGAALYLYKTLRPKKSKTVNCGCGTTDCKVPKAKLINGATGTTSSAKD